MMAVVGAGRDSPFVVRKKFRLEILCLRASIDPRNPPKEHRDVD